MSFEEVLFAAPSHITENSASFTLEAPFEASHSDIDSSPSRRSNRKPKKKTMTDLQDAPLSDGEEPSGTTKKTGTGKSRRELPAGAVATLKAWLLSPEHFTHPYPTPQDQITLMNKTGIDKKQLKNWFTNARRRIWKPMLKKQLEQGKIQQTTIGGVVAMPGATIGAPAVATDYGAPSGPMIDHTQGGQPNYQQVLQPQSAQQQTYDQYGTATGYVQPQQNPYSSQNPYGQNQGQYNQNESMTGTNSIGSLPNLSATGSNLNKTDSHAVLMELFARDQDLVRQATKDRAGGNSQNGEQQPQEGTHVQNQLGSQHPMNKIAGGSSTFNKLGNVPSMNSWPHFSSVSSLNNLGTMTGVKSITNMSGVDLASQGSLNRKGNLAQVKSIENFGRADSYAFLEVFFDKPEQTQRGIKREREEDDNVGLSLDGDEGSSPAATVLRTTMENTIKSAAPVAAPLPADGQDKEGLKRAYDDALAARGLISVSRSSEKLTDLALPAKMQRTISQEYLKSMNAGSTTFTTFSFNSTLPSQQPPPVASPAPAPAPMAEPTHQVPPMHPAAQPQQQYQAPQIFQNMAQINPNASDSVEVPATTKCALCHCINVDTQLRPCGHMFHGKCLKPSIQNAVGAPQCPIDKTTMVSAVLAVPTDENANSNSTSTPYTGGVQGSNQQESSSVPGI